MLGNPGAATKTMKTLYKAFSACSDQPIPYTEFVDNLYFFDDVYHRDIAFRIGDRYFQNPPYRYDADPSVVQSCFKTAFFKAGLHEDPDYFEYIAPIFGSKPKTFETINEIVLHDYSQFRRKKNLPNNTTFRRKFNLTFPPTRRINHSLFKTALQRIRSLERKQNSGSQLSPNEETTLENAGKTVTTYELQQQGGKSKRYRRTRKNSKN